ncbi:MAG: hypothetical protein VX709_15310 [Pseudomonadota bacterium]|nr:hypothetical protein [Pseudomonadales bacterium]MEC7370658.1 hypothetical protein [Pseudomonadota bacterium]
MHDGITFEQTGKRAVVLCTEPFIVTAKNIARVMGLPDYPFVVLDHPIGSCTASEIQQKAAQAADQAERILLEI